MSTHTPSQIDERFRQLVDTWEAAVAHYSFSAARQRHPAYQEIIALGEPVIPSLLRDLEVNRRYWFAALPAITGANPVSPEHAGQIDRMIEDWLGWGTQRGYQW
jgi:hypothetical protein